MRRSFAALGVSVLCLVAGIGASSNAVAPTARRNEPRLLPASAVTADVSAAIPSLRTPTPMFAAYAIVMLAMILMAALLCYVALQRRRAATVRPANQLIRLRGPPRPDGRLLPAS